jgi:mannitol 2-dehydrogenase
MTVPLKLSHQTLQQLDSSIERPAYDRARRHPSIVHIGVGGFHRAHQAVYLDDLLRLSEGDSWFECGMGLLEADASMLDALKSQDYLYTVFERSEEGRRARVIGSIVDYVLAPPSPEAAIERLAEPEVKVVSLTITEGGYLRDDATGKLLETDARVVFDLENPSRPKTYLGYLAAALERRMQSGIAPFTLMSCDNVESNGDMLRTCLTSFCELRNPGLRRWIEAHVAFPNSMVDRITPGTTDADREQLGLQFGIVDAWPVVTEPFRQWVIEDKFSSGRPRWEEVGVEFTTDVHVFEVMKMSLLNGGHLAIAYISSLLGYQFVHQAMNDPVVTDFLTRFMDAVTPVVQPPLGVNLEAYKATLVERFANPTIFDQVQRIASEGAAKMPKFVVPSITKLLSKGLSTAAPAILIASWIRYLEGIDERGKPIAILDGSLKELQASRTQSASGVEGILAMKPVFGGLEGAQSTNPAQYKTFVEEVKQAVASLKQHGVVRTLSRSN